MYLWLQIWLAWRGYLAVERLKCPSHPRNPPVIPGEVRCLEPLKGEPQDMFGGSNTYSKGIWMSRV